MSINIERKREIYETPDYDQFQLQRGNREVTEGHVNNIKVSMKIHGNLMDLYPLVVQRKRKGKKEYLIIKDGQHRFEAARQLGLTIHYTIDGEERLNLQTIIDVNAAQKSWSMRDFLGSYCIRDFPEYLRTREYITTYPIPLAMACQLMAGSRRQSWAKEFKRGQFKVREWDWACVVGDACVDFAHYHTCAFTRPFLNAVTMMLRNECYDHEQMLQKLPIAAHMIFERSTDTDQYFEMLQTIYNYKQHARNVQEFRMLDGNGRYKKAGRWVPMPVGEEAA